jgi:transcriptional regulator with XRE-family HTH domain
MDFAQALRQRRNRRRLSQLELAMRAGTTQRHVSFLESGRSEPGRDMVVRLAESLDLPLRERNSLLIAAGFTPAYPRTAPDDPGMATVQIVTTITTIATAVDITLAELKLETFLPMDESTTSILTRRWRRRSQP